MVVSVAGKYGKCTLTIYIMDIRDINWLTTMLIHLTSMLLSAHCGKISFWCKKKCFKKYKKILLFLTAKTWNLIVFNSYPKSNSAAVCNVMIQMVDVGSGGGYLVDNRSLMMSIVGSSRATIVTLHKCYWPYSYTISDCSISKDSCIHSLCCIIFSRLHFITYPFEVDWTLFGLMNSLYFRHSRVSNWQNNQIGFFCLVYATKRQRRIFK